MVGSIHLHCITIVWECFQDGPSLCPGPGGLPSLVLDGHGVTREQGGKVFGSLIELFMLEDLSSGQGRRSLVCSYSPFRAGCEFSWLYGEEISQYSSKQNLGGGEASCGASIVPVCQHGPGKPIGI